MKRTGILLMLVLFVITMAQPASALVELTEFPDGCYCIELEGDYYVAVPAIAANSEDYPSYHIETVAQACKTGDDIDVTIISSNPGVTIDELNIISLYQEQIILSANGTCEMGHTFNGTMTLAGDGESYTSTSATGTLDGLYPANGEFSAVLKSGNCEEEIPEFPTIALPMVAIIGLALIIQRRKD